MAEQEILRYGDLTSEKRPVMSVERNGEEVVLRGFVDGKRCPASVRSQISAARREWAADPTQANWYTFVRAHLLAVVDGLEDGEADVLAGDADEHRPILEKLGWWREADDEDTDVIPLAEARTSTTDPSSPISSTPTEPALSISSTTSE